VDEVVKRGWELIPANERVRLAPLHSVLRKRRLRKYIA